MAALPVGSGCTGLVIVLTRAEALHLVEAQPGVSVARLRAEERLPTLNRDVDVDRIKLQEARPALCLRGRDQRCAAAPDDTIPCQRTAGSASSSSGVGSSLLL
jgi:hypothetical protein